MSEPAKDSSLGCLAVIGIVIITVLWIGFTKSIEAINGLREDVKSQQQQHEQPSKN
jgi:hypothetical protein